MTLTVTVTGLDSLVDALNRNTDALLKASGAPASTGAAATTTGKADKKSSKTTAAKVTQDQMNAALLKIKDEFGIENARPIIEEQGKVKKMSEIKPEHYEAVYNAAVAKYDELKAGGSDDENGDL